MPWLQRYSLIGRHENSVFTCSFIFAFVIPPTFIHQQLSVTRTPRVKLNIYANLIDGHSSEQVCHSRTIPPVEVHEKYSLLFEQLQWFFLSKSIYSMSNCWLTTLCCYYYTGCSSTVLLCSHINVLCTSPFVYIRPHPFCYGYVRCYEVGTLFCALPRTWTSY